MDSNDTRSSSYTDRLRRLEGSLFKKIVTPINPYRWNIRKMSKGSVLDIGCGIGRNLRYLNRSDVLGVDHNHESVDYVNNLGFRALTVESFQKSSEQMTESFDSILISHVLEHLTVEEADELIAFYLPYLKPGGRVIAICPQERGYASDSTHKTYFSIDALEKLLSRNGLIKIVATSFPLPRIFGRLFIYNENIVMYSK